MQTAATIQRKLTEFLAPSALEIVDESHLHAGHAGARPEGETHFRVRVVAAAFDGKSRLERHRMIHRLLTPSWRAAFMRLRSPRLRRAKPPPGGDRASADAAPLVPYRTTSRRAGSVA